MRPAPSDFNADFYSNAAAEGILASSLRAAMQFFGLRERYLFTRGKRLRLRYASMPLAWLCVGGIAFSVAAAAPEPIRTASGMGLVYTAGAAERAIGRQVLGILEEAQPILAPLPLDYADASDDTGSSDPADSGPLRFRIGSGDTIAGILDQAGISASDTNQITSALGKQIDPRDVRPGQIVSLEFDPDAENGKSLSRMEVFLDSVRSVALSRSDDGDFDVAVNEKEVHREISAHKAIIEDSLYASAIRAKIPPAIIADAIRIYSYDVDFQRDVKPGDSLDVMYDSYVTGDGDRARQGKILYASLTVGGREIPLYRFTRQGGEAEYYTKDGKTIRKSLLRTPIDGARITSGFGMRRHPILGYTKMHKGMDFGAPRGTPIFASGAGTIEKAGRFGGYGNYIRIRHNGSTKTAYGHLNGFAKGIRPGVKVRQGQVIGYVGTTGRSTGPHLHYEVIVNNVPVNPAKVKMAQGDSLGGKDLKKFRAQIAQLHKEYAQVAMSDVSQVMAQAETGSTGP